MARSTRTSLARLDFVLPRRSARCPRERRAPELLPERFDGLPKDVLEACFGGGTPEHAGLTLTTTPTNQEALEVNSVRLAPRHKPPGARRDQLSNLLRVWHLAEK